MRRPRPNTPDSPVPSAPNINSSKRAVPPESRGFGPHLRRWRELRGLSQLDLALGAGSSQRHVSFLESGRTSPSRDMVLRLAGVLDVPLRQQNGLLLAAGFAPAWRESAWSAPDLARVNAALDHMLAQQEPYPGVVVDRRWNLLRANRGAAAMMAFLGDPNARPSPGPISLAEAILSPDGIRKYLRNWQEVAVYFLRGVQADALADGTPETAELLQRLLRTPGLPALYDLPAPDQAQAPVLTLHLERDGTTLRLFTAIATLGTPQDVTVQELRIETFYPADETTALHFKRWAQESPKPT